MRTHVERRLKQIIFCDKEASPWELVPHRRGQWERASRVELTSHQYERNNYDTLQSACFGGS